MNNLHIMLDLETMGLGPNSALTAIGAVQFDTGGTGESFYRVVDLGSSVKHGLDIEANAVLWWLEQSDSARKQLVRDDRVDLDNALLQFSGWLEAMATKYNVSYSDIIVWGNGPGFDNKLLANAYQAIGLDAPWPWWNDRCYRTLSMLYPQYVTRMVTGTAHNALDDATHQARCAARMLAAAGNLEDPYQTLKTIRSTSDE